ncbi:MAG: glutamine-hydrolyzing GMP synthase, partial [Actinobacteria bacterium]|nr:glutamine-hydrolyzing GMP synthase [Actinomycetota bacterium]
MIVQRNNLVLVLDFGAQYAQLIARRVRQANVYSEIVPSTISVDEILARNPRAIILSGGPSSVYAESAPTLDKTIFDLDIPIFGICYGFQAMAQALGGKVAKTGVSEFGRTKFKADTNSKIFSTAQRDFDVWMSHGDSVTDAPPGFVTVGSTEHTPVAAFENSNGTLSGVQFHPEVLHTEYGQEILRHWLIDVVKCKPTWTSENIIDNEITNIKSIVGNERVICGLSGGVDSAVAAALVQRAIGNQLTCVFVDHGLLRAGEAEQVERDFVAATGVTLMVVDARERFLHALRGVTEPEEKRKIIGREFIRVFEDAARKISSK